MSEGIRPLHPGELNAALEEVILPTLLKTLAARSPGHCMRLLDLDRELMILLASRLRAEATHAQTVILDDGAQGRSRQPMIPSEFAVTATKLVELRNPQADGSLRQPLLVMIPPGTRTAAEDSFDVATFEEIKLGDIYGDLRDHLLSKIPLAFRAALTRILDDLSQQGWRYANEVAIVRCLLTAYHNTPDAQSIGASLYELGLVPDFDLFNPRAQPVDRVRRNRAAVETLTWSPHSERRRVLNLNLADASFRAKLGAFLEETGLDDPRQWTRQIAHERKRWGLAFHQWTFADEPQDPSSLCIDNVQVQLPEVIDAKAHTRTAEFVGQHVLMLGSGPSPKLKVSFDIDPHPARVDGLDKFVVQVVSKNNGPIGLSTSRKARKTGKPSVSLTFGKLDKVDWEEGWHFVRVLAVNAQGEALTLLDATGARIPDPVGDGPSDIHHANESDYFYVILDDEDLDIEQPQRAIPYEDSRTHALFAKQFSAVLNNADCNNIDIVAVQWQDQPSKRGKSPASILELKFRREGMVQVRLSPLLTEIEQQILRRPDGPLSWRVVITDDGPKTPSPDVDHWPSRHDEVQQFLDARAAYFAAVRQGDHGWVTQAADLRTLTPLAVAYAEQYTRVLNRLLYDIDAGGPDERERARNELGRLLLLDTVGLTMRDHRDGARQAALLAPTHPLRALWFAAWSQLGKNWLAALADGLSEHVTPTRQTLLNLLSPLNFPPALYQNGRLYAGVDNIHPFWSLYAPADEANPRALIGDLCSALGLPEPGIAGSIIDGPYLASKVKRYLAQHPYVTTLVINAFNAGHATALADMLVNLQRQPEFADLRYDIRMFVPDPDSPGAGEALIELLHPATTSASETVDAFSDSSGDHLQPKLALAVRSIDEFRKAAASHTAHISMLFDVFPPEEVGAEVAWQQDGIAPLHGLVQDFHAAYHQESELAIWRRQPLHGSALPLPDAEELTDHLSRLPHLISTATAAVATGQWGGDRRPTIKLVLDGLARHLLFQVHEVSDWVFTIDRNLGIEFFDHGPQDDRPAYLIDHSPDLTSRSGHRLVITSRATTEIEAMIAPLLAAYELPTTRNVSLTVLDQLRSLSGRLALKLISATNQRAEALGLALARIYLEHQGAFVNQLAVPLDVHLDLYRASRQQVDELGGEVSFKRTDLALFDLDAIRRTITCRLVEVKCYSDVGPLSAYQSMQAQIAAQIDQSEKTLRQHFDPDLHVADRPDRSVKSHELGMLLGFYLERAVRYAMITQDAAEEARQFIRTLEGGYRLSFTRSALIFDFAKPGTEKPTIEEGIEYHRIGHDLVHELLDAYAALPTSTSTWTDAEDQTIPLTPMAVHQRRERIPSVPTLSAAAFKASPRRHTTVPDENIYVRRLRDLAESYPTLALGQPPLASNPQKTAGQPEVPPRLDPESNNEERTPMPLTPAAQEAAALLKSANDGAVSEPPTMPDTPDAPVEGKDLPHAASASLISSNPTAGSTAPDASSHAVHPPNQEHPLYDVILGATSDSPQFGLLGERAGRKIALDLNQTHTISLFGVQGGGKSYTLGAIVEMATLRIPNINRLPKPLATVIFHYSPTMDYAPEFTSMVAPNDNEQQLNSLHERYGAVAHSLKDIVLLVPEDQLSVRQAEYPNIEVQPLKFAAAELQVSHWRFLMGAVGNQATYVRQILRIMRTLRHDLTLSRLRAEIEASSLSDHLKNLGLDRLAMAGDFIDDTMSVSTLLRPGRLVIVDLRDEFLEKDAALGLFVVLLQLFADAKYQGDSFNKLVVFDEAHKYIENADLVDGLVEVVREMRHKATSIMVASQDPPSVPTALIELSSQIILHRFNSPQWLKHIQRANTSLSNLTADRMAQLGPGEAYVWSAKASDGSFSREAIKIACRPRVTRHGGDTRTAVDL
jgi:hypothetical protein